jgi:flavin-dependent thymidylate synthase
MTSNPSPWLPIGPFREWLLAEAEALGSRRALCRELEVQYSTLLKWLKTNKWVPLDTVDAAMVLRDQMWTDIYDEDDLVSSATARRAKEGRVQLNRQVVGDGYTASRALSDKREEGITKDFAFNKLSFDGGAIKSPSDNGHVDIGVDDIEVRLVQGIDEAAFKRTLSMATKATLGVDLNKPMDEGDWEEMLKGGLQTALETQVIVFAVSGVSRACTHQLVRSRKAAFHQQSMRAHFYGSRPEFRIPESVWAKSEKLQNTWLRAMEACHKAYVDACEEGVSYQDARYALQEGTTNFILLEYPVREFLNVYAYRACSMFQWEIVQVMRLAKGALVTAHPWIEPYVKISCEKTKGALDSVPGQEDKGLGEDHHCTFQGWEQVEGQCDFPWARESNRTFRSERHEIKRRGDEPAAAATSQV